MYNRLGVFKGLVYKFESNIAREGTAGFCRELGCVELIALNLGSGKAVGFAFLEAYFVVVLEALSALVDIGSSYISRADSGVLVDEGNGVAAVSRYGAGCLALCSDELVVIENAAVGISTVGAALSVLGGLGLENRAAVGDMVYRECAEALGYAEVIEVACVGENERALSGYAYAAARNGAEALEACAAVGGRDDRPVGGRQVNRISLRAAVYENREILPLGSLGVGVGVSDNVAVV